MVPTNKVCLGLKKKKTYKTVISFPLLSFPTDILPSKTRRDICIVFAICLPVGAIESLFCLAHLCVTEVAQCLAQRSHSVSE